MTFRMGVASFKEAQLAPISLVAFVPGGRAWKARLEDAIAIGQVAGCLVQSRLGLTKAANFGLAGTPLPTLLSCTSLRLSLKYVHAACFRLQIMVRFAETLLDGTVTPVEMVPVLSSTFSLVVAHFD